MTSLTVIRQPLQGRPEPSEKRSVALYKGVLQNSDGTNSLFVCFLKRPFIAGAAFAPVLVCMNESRTVSSGSHTVRV
jgi:hypothetical protein